MRLMLAMLTGVIAMLALSSAVARAAAYASIPAQAHEVVAIASSGDLNGAIGHCSDAKGQCSRDRCDRGKCDCALCAGAGTAIYLAPDFALRLAVAHAAPLMIPGESLPGGVTVRPITRPPRLSA
jgi:hypothetical protein